MFKTHTRGLGLGKLLMLMLFLPALVIAGERSDLKKMCREEFQACKKNESAKVCRARKKQCKIDNHVTLKDDINHIQNQLFNFAQKVAGTVELSLGNDERQGEYIEIRVHTKLNVDMGDMAYYPHNYSSYVSFASNGDYKDFILRVFTKDLEKHGVGEELQTSEGRSFPKFIDGVKYETIYGEEIKTKNSFLQLYFDGEKQIVGLFIPSPFVGNSITKLNELMAKIPVVGGALPKVNSIPVNIKLKKEKVGRISLLSSDSEGNNSGFVLLLDHQSVKEILQKN